MKPLSDLEIALLKTILKDARKSIKGEKDYFLCVAIAALKEKYGNEPTKYLRRWIRKMLGGHTILESWISDHRGAAACTMRDTVHYRIQWINWMIGQLDAELVGRQGFAA